MGVKAVEVRSRGPWSGGQSFGRVGPYEELAGTVRLSVDPDHPRNQIITDLELAPRNAGGLVEFSTDFSIIRPADPERGNHRVLFEIPNRGKRRVFKHMHAASESLDPTVPLQPGNGFLMRHGYTVAWCGWQPDVPPVEGLMRMTVPDAVFNEGEGEGEGPLSGKIIVTFQPNARAQVQALSDAMHRPYATRDLNDPEATLIVRDNDDAPVQVVPRDQWSFAKLVDGRVVPDASHVYTASGFDPGKMHQVLYTTTGAPVIGLGLLAVRDVGSFLKYGRVGDGNPCAGDVEYAYGYGLSQSGRFLRHFLYLALNEDEEGRMVFDGLIPHVAGGRRGEFNQRFGQPSTPAKRSMGNLFPFTDTEQTDPETGKTDGLLSRQAARGKVPKIVFTNTSAEYWRGDGSLIHTDVDGTRDVATSESVRIYCFAGTHHPSGFFPLTDTHPVNGHRGERPLNSLDYTPLVRAAVVALDRWVTSGDAPPPSRYPRIGDGTLVPPEQTEGTFRSIPGVRFPGHLPCTSRLDFGPGAEAGVPTTVPPAVGKTYRHLVSAVDEDGNELGGIRLPDISVPLATHTGWNLRHPEMGASDEVVGMFIGLLGSTIVFPATRDERDASGDPRLSIEERYKSKEDYLGRVRRAAQTLVEEGYLIGEDLESVVEEASQRYDVFRKAVKEPQVADD